VTEYLCEVEITFEYGCATKSTERTERYVSFVNIEAVNITHIPPVRVERAAAKSQSLIQYELE
jgi:hypothetical protein